MATISETFSPSGPANVGREERLISTVGGGTMALLGLVRGGIGGMALAALGGILVYRGTTGHCPAYTALGVNTAEEGEREPPSLRIVRTVTVARPRQEVYDFWKEVENFPRFMRHIESVEDLGEGRSRWSARLFHKADSVTWEAQTVEDRPGEALSWRSLPDSQVENSGSVSFTDGGEGETRVRVGIEYRPPVAAAGLAKKVLDPVLSQIVKEDIRGFKALMETGEVPTVEGQPSGR